MTLKARSKNIVDEAPLSVQHFLDFGISISGRLKDIHKQDFIHGDIRPENISWDSKANVCKLTEPVTFKTLQSLLDRVCLPYISPEQTGRMNRKVGYSSDLYSLGAVFYKLLTGNPPFVSGDPLEIIHSHIAKNPRPLSELNSEVPTQISKIVIRLLEKNPEDRYQSASGLQKDLKRCDAQLSGTGKLEEFKLRESDLGGVFTIPQKLYGRDNEIKILLNAFDRISEKNKKLLLVSGYSGVGKSALVHEVHKPITARRGYFIEGKFDQYQRNIPYWVWGQAFSVLMNYLLMESEARLTVLKATILEAIGRNGKVLTDVIPALELVIGPQPDVPELGGQEAQNRFNYVIQNFIKAIAQKDHPLVIFLDDLQWIDSASLNLIKVLLTDPNQAYYLIIGAYRDNEVDATHPLLMGVAELQKQSVSLLEYLKLQNLSAVDVNTLISDTLQCALADSRPLSQLVYAKTAGNAFFTHQLLQTLAEEKLLIFDSPTRRWQWDMAALQAMAISDNVVELMTSKVQRLPLAAQTAMKQAACIGNRFTLATLAIIAQKAEETMQADLQIALQEEIIFSLNDGYKFAHDRIQQAAYSLIPDVDKEATHLEIGRLLLKHISDQEQKKKIFDIVNHLNIGAKLISEHAEQTQLAGLNLMAGKRAKQATAYESALPYFSFGIDLLGEHAWKTHYRLTLDLSNEAAEVAFLSGQHARMEELSASVFSNTRTIADKMRVIDLAISYELKNGHFDRAIHTGLKYLRELGLDLDPAPSREEAYSSMADSIRLLERQSVEKLVNLPELDDPRLVHQIHIITRIADSNAFANWNLLVLTISIAIKLLVRHGNTPHAPMTYAFYSYVLTCVNSAQYKVANLAGEIAVGLLRTQSSDAMRCPVLHLLHSYVFQYFRAIKDNIKVLFDTYHIGVEHGNLHYASYCATDGTMSLLCSGAKLGHVLYEAEGYMPFLKKHELAPAFFFCLTIVGFVCYLRDPTNCKFDPARYYQLKMNAAEGRDECRATVHRLIDYQFLQTLAVHFGHYTEAIGYGEEAHECAVTFGAAYPTQRLYFYDALACLRVFETTDQDRRRILSERIDRDMDFLRTWAGSAPMNFEHMLYLALAEQARIGDRPDSAASLYEQAINTARQHGFNQDCALSYDLAADYYRQNGFDHIYRLYKAKAHQAYREWGALALVKHLEKQLPKLSTNEAYPTVESQYHTRLDLNTVIKASQTISGEIKLDRLLSKMMNIIIENAGAQIGFLILEKEKQWVIEAEGSIGKESERLVRSTSLESNDTVPDCIIQYVIRTQGPVWLDDAANKGDFKDEPEILQRRPKSILSVPLINQGKVSAIVYLENNLATGAFTSERVELLRVLSSQMALALDNAQLYSEMGVRVFMRTAELEQEIKIRKQAEAAAEYANKTKSAFLANMSHELRTPLTAILGFSRMMVRETDVTADQQDKLSIINRSGEHLLSMVNDVLDLSKIEAGRVELIIEPFDLHLMLKNICKTFELRAKDAGLDFELNIDADLVRYVRADSGKLRQILVNLLSNAVKFTGQGTISLRARSISIPGDPSMVGLQLEVEDSGCGISPELIGNIFEPFYQVGATQSGSKGTGLGLAISKSFVEMMGGKISVDSTPGKGSLFRVERPLALADAAQMAEAGSPDSEVLGLAPGQSAWRVLIVEDNMENRLLLSSLLHNAGFEVWEAENGEEAIDHFQQWQPHFIWMDMRMPVMDGYKATAKIRSLPGGDRVKIVAITASAFREQRQEILEAGCDDVLLKPFKENDFFEVMARLLNIKYLYRDMGAEVPQEQSINLTAEMLGELPGELLLELREATLALDREAIFAIIERVAPLSPDTAKGLQVYMNNFQLGLISDLLGENHEK
jgi:predicted ATPase/signal transduction histidine kinase/CheY-like chemotaxis protein